MAHEMSIHHIFISYDTWKIKMFHYHHKKDDDKKVSYITKPKTYQNK